MSCHALTFFRRNIMGNFSEIKTRNDFADFLRIPRNKLTHILYVKKPDSYYKTFEIPIKRTKPRRRIACSGVRLCAETSEKPYFKRFSGIEKVHRNSIKITVDLWQMTLILIETV